LAHNINRLVGTAFVVVAALLRSPAIVTLLVRETRLLDLSFDMRAFEFNSRDQRVMSTAE
jgi:hypothetical protein